MYFVPSVSYAIRGHSSDAANRAPMQMIEW